MSIQKQVETWQAIDYEILGVQTCIPVQVVVKIAPLFTHEWPRSQLTRYLILRYYKHVTLTYICGE